MKKTAIVLVPEISLTPQMLDRFISRFGKEKIAVLHSKLSIGEKYDEWNKIKEGKAKIVIGARSAIFAPVTNLGIIIIDEEHDSSYKSEANPKYDAKQVAKYIAKQNNCPLVFGSATPDINTYYKAKTLGKIELLELTKRANNSSLPKVNIIDLKQELANGNRSMLSRELYQEIEENLKQNPKIEDYVRAQNVVIETYNAQDLDFKKEEVGILGSPTMVQKAYRPKSERNAQKIDERITFELFSLIKEAKGI